MRAWSAHPERRALALLLAAACEPDVRPPQVITPLVETELPTCETGVRTCDAWGCWVSFCGGSYWMGSPEGLGDPDESPQRTVTIPPLQALETELTLPAWTACVAAGACAEIAAITDDLCNRAEQGDDDALPVNCIDWQQAADVCAFVDARLPSEAEWEYLARSAGADEVYPWGDAPPSCDTVILDWEQNPDGCSRFGTYPVCTVPAGNTAQGLCDLAGNVLEWAEDWFHDDYAGAPTDGSPDLREPHTFRVMRGGGTGSSEEVRSANRVFHPPEFWYPGLGVRCVR